MTHTRRTEESEKLQQFSTPLTLGFLAHHAAQVRADDTILEPSAGTGLLAVYGAVSGCQLILTQRSQYIDGFYNPKRRHSTLNYVSPMQFENQTA
ncbi:MAG: hypothetical protein COA81_13135 [Alphaproteobacteria bacterium]|nr:MAG: hypothetical protein COA81_13135 [Alphaproteobacteria bacterium]